MEGSTINSFSASSNSHSANEDSSSATVYTDLSSDIQHNQRTSQHASSHQHSLLQQQQLQAHGTVYQSCHQQDIHDHDESESDDGSSPKPKCGKKTRGRVKVRMQFINNKLRRYTTFSKRKTGIMKKAYELSTLTGTQVMLLVASETGHVYTFATKKLQPMITSESGKALIQTCLNSPEGGIITQHDLDNDRRMNPNGFEETELCYAAAGEDEEGAGDEAHDLLLNGEDVSDGHGDELVSSSNVIRATHTSTSSVGSGVGNTFSIHTIIPPTSNSDGTMGKVTNLSMQVPQPASLSRGNGSLSQHQSAHVLFSSEVNDSAEQPNSRQRLPIIDFSHRPPSDEQHQEINKLSHSQQRQVQNSQQNSMQHSPQLNSQQQIVIPKSALLTVGAGQPSSAVVYRQPQNPTLVYAPSNSISNQLTDTVALVNIVTSQPNSYSTSSVAAISEPSPSQQYITIPYPVLQQVMGTQQDLGNKS